MHVCSHYTHYIVNKYGITGVFQALTDLRLPEVKTQS